jgi:dolichol-phosphate mannosyltransferase
VRAKRKGENFFKRFTAKWFYRIISRLTNISIPVDTGDFRLMSRRAVDSLNRMREDNRFIRGMVSWIGFRQTGISFERESRFAGETKYPFKKMLKLALDGIVSFSNVGLKLSTYLGFLASTFSFLYIIFIVVAHFLGKTIPGYASIMAAILFFSGVQLITTGIVGEYIGRIYDEVKDRPLYLVKNSGGFEGANQSKLEKEKSC